MPKQRGAAYRVLLNGQEVAGLFISWSVDSLLMRLLDGGWQFTVGSGYTEGLKGGAAVPLFNCHSFHGSIHSITICPAPPLHDPSQQAGPMHSQHPPV